MTSSSSSSKMSIALQEEGIIDNMDASTLALLIFFGITIFATVGIATRSWLAGDTHVFKFWLQTVLNPPAKLSTAIETKDHHYKSRGIIWAVLCHTSCLGVIVLFVYIVETHPILSTIIMDRYTDHFDADLFWFVLLLVSMFACKHSWIANAENSISTNKKTQARNKQNRKSNREIGNDDDSDEMEFIQLRPKPKRGSANDSIHSNELRSILLDHNNGAFDTTALSSASKNKNKKHKVKNGKTEKDSNVDDEIEANIDFDEILTEADDDEDNEEVKRTENETITPAQSHNDLLNLYQSNECKGILTTCFLLYQYTNASHPINEVGVSCFLFFTGFGHTYYFYTQQDYSYGRVMRVLLRMNLVAACFCMTDMYSNSYIIVYYINALHSFFFIFTFVAMKFYNKQNITKFGLRFKMIGVGIILFLIWDVDYGLFRLLHQPFYHSAPLLMWKWYYQTHLHHWAFFVGIIFAINHPICSLWVRKVENISQQRLVTAAKGIVAMAFLAALYLWASGPLLLLSSGTDQQKNNGTSSPETISTLHAYFCFVPILAYIYLRNLTPYLRSHHIGMYEKIGKHSLEIYLLHHHIFLNQSGTAKIFFFFPPSYPICNLILSLFLLYSLAMVLRTVTMVLVNLLLPVKKVKNYVDDKRCFQHMGVMLSIMTVLYVVAKILKLYILNVGSILSIIIILGILIYQTLIDLTMSKTLEGKYSVSTIAQVCPPLVGSMTIIMISILWHVIILQGKSTLSYYENHQRHVSLPYQCTENINTGKWTTLTSCNEFQRGNLARNYQISTLSDCEIRDQSQWGWTNNHKKDGCAFRFRSSLEWQEKLSHNRNILFIGDTIVRSLYHATCKALGDSTIHEFDSSIPLHSDITKTFGQNSSMKYVWAPLAMDGVSKLKEYIVFSNSINKKKKVDRHIDLIVMGGGVWDRLHVWATDEDQESHKAVVRKLASELQYLREKLGVSIVWVRPTTINTKALNNEEKRSLMSEENIDEMRTLYTELGIDEAVDTVIDGPTFTADKIDESHDGVHYPPYVYDVGAQLLGNSLDWLLLPSTISPPAQSPRIGSLSNPFLGLMMLCFAMIGLLFFDAYFGFSYLSSLFVRDNAIPVSNIIDYYTAKDDKTKDSFIFSVMPNDLYEEAFRELHNRWGINSDAYTNDDQKEKSEYDISQATVSTENDEIFSFFARNDSENSTSSFTNQATKADLKSVGQFSTDSSRRSQLNASSFIEDPHF
jgi:hypothetical protein